MGGLGLVAYYVIVAIAFILGIAATFFFNSLSSYTAIPMEELPNDMVPVELEVLQDFVASESQSKSTLTSKAFPRRRRLRLELAAVQVRLHRMLANAARPKYCARNDQRLMRKHRREHPPEIADAIKQVLAAERELTKLTRRTLFRIWLWNLSGFHKREWGPMPDARTFHIPEILAAYDSVKSATIALLRACGHAVLAEEIATVM